jgi:hypothetical protein
MEKYLMGLFSISSKGTLSPSPFVLTTYTKRANFRVNQVNLAKPQKSFIEKGVLTVFG